MSDECVDKLVLTITQLDQMNDLMLREVPPEAQQLILDDQLTRLHRLGALNPDEVKLLQSLSEGADVEHPALTGPDGSPNLCGFLARGIGRTPAIDVIPVSEDGSRRALRYAAAAVAGFCWYGTAGAVTAVVLASHHHPE